MNPHVKSALLWIAAATAVALLGLYIFFYMGKMPRDLFADPPVSISGETVRPEPTSPAPPPVN